MAKHSAEDWFVGESQLDRDEYGFDGTVWAPPSQEERTAEVTSKGEYVAEPYLVAKGIRHKPYAQLIAAAPDLLAALKGVLRVADRKTDEFDAARAAVAKAESRS